MVFVSIYTFLADNEWGNSLMDQIAKETFEQFPEVDVVHVHEHAGWHLSFHRDGFIINSANDAAAFPPHVIQWWREHRKEECIGQVRRQNDGNHRVHLYNKRPVCV